MADKEGKRCYLESSKGEPNVEIYKKMGFEVVDEVDCVDGEVKCKVCFHLHIQHSKHEYFILLEGSKCSNLIPQLYGMVRDPQPTA